MKLLKHTHADRPWWFLINIKSVQCHISAADICFRLSRNALLNQTHANTHIHTHIKHRDIHSEREPKKNAPKPTVRVPEWHTINYRLNESCNRWKPNRIIPNSNRPPSDEPQRTAAQRRSVAKECKSCTESIMLMSDFIYIVMLIECRVRWCFAHACEHCVRIVTRFLCKYSNYVSVIRINCYFIVIENNYATQSNACKPL